MNPPRLAAPPLPYVVTMTGTRLARLALGTARTWTLPMQVPPFSECRCSMLDVLRMGTSTGVARR